MHRLFTPLVFLLIFVSVSNAERPTLRVGVVGLTHDHVHAVLRRHKQGDLQIVGIAEANRTLVERHAKRYGFKSDIVFDSVDAMLDATKPEVVSDYGSIHGHLATVEECAPRGIDVMVEKPLAVSLDHVRKMQKLVARHDIHLLTNYETTWYPSHHEAKRILGQHSSLGDIRKIVVHDGHPGPIEIGCSKEFVEWLTDPKLNGAGALTDFGCYGANLSTWLMNGEKPQSVTAVTQQIKPSVYPKVDDEATIVLTYPRTQAILQASWNWNYNRKDIEIYCKRGYVHCPNRDKLVVMPSEKDGSSERTPTKLQPQQADPYVYLAGVVRGDIAVKPTDLSSLENNVTVVEILEAAKISAKEGRTVRLSDVVSTD